MQLLAATRTNAGNSRLALPQESCCLGFAAGCAARLCLAGAAEFTTGFAPGSGLPQRLWAKGRTKGKAHENLIEATSEAQPRCTSGGKAAAEATVLAEFCRRAHEFAASLALICV